MMRPHRPLCILFAAVLAIQSLLLAATPARAQFFDESLEQEDLFVEDEDAFFEDRGGGFGEDTGGPTTGEPDFTEGDRFIDEQLVPADQRALTEGGRQFQLTLGRERETLPLNVAWGAGTGLLIGGWFALIGEGDNRQTQRSIGLGIVSGIILGLMVGTRTVFNPEAPRPTAPVSDAARPADEGSRIEPIVAFSPGESRLGFRLTF
jgi:hypothetical protein